jgi:hypothetical protein
MTKKTTKKPLYVKGFFLFRCDLLFFRGYTEKPENSFFLISAITSRINANCGKLSTLSPAFNSKGRDTKQICDFTDSE